MTKTVRICDCCKREIPNTESLYECQKELRTWRNYKQLPLKWELCLDCIEHLENVLISEIQHVDAWRCKC